MAPSGNTGSSNGADSASDDGIATKGKREAGRGDVDLNEDELPPKGIQRDSEKEVIKSKPITTLNISALLYSEIEQERQRQERRQDDQSFHQRRDSGSYRQRALR